MADIIPLMGTDTNNTLDALAYEYLRGRKARGELTHKSAASIGCTLRGLSDSFGRRPLTRFGTKAIDRWLETIGDYRPATRRTYISRVRCFTDWLLAERKITSNPIAHVSPVKQPRHIPVTLTAGQVAAVLAVCPDDRGRAIVMLMVGLGCRCIEIERLCVEDYDGETRTIIIRGKGQHERELPVPYEVAAVLDRYLDSVGRTAGPMFRGERGPMKTQTIGKYVRGWMREAGVKRANLDGRSAHALRRTAGSDVMDRVGDIRIVQAMLGHARVETTAKYYLRPVPLDKMREAMEGRRYAA